MVRARVWGRRGLGVDREHTVELDADGHEHGHEHGYEHGYEHEHEHALDERRHVVERWFEPGDVKIGWTTALVVTLTAGACDGEAVRPGGDAASGGAGGSTGGAGGLGGAGGGPFDCPGSSPRVRLGQGHPIVPFPEGAPVVLPFETGGQGAYHVQFSLGFEGPFDPDHADLDVRLVRGDWTLATYRAQDVLLSTVGGVCSYDNLRLVLVDEAGGVLPQARLDPLVDQTGELSATITSAGRTATLRQTVTFGAFQDDGYLDAGLR